jgi:hypothetical protein
LAAARSAAAADTNQAVVEQTPVSARDPYITSAGEIRDRCRSHRAQGWGQDRAMSSRTGCTVQ